MFLKNIFFKPSLPYSLNLKELGFLLQIFTVKENKRRLGRIENPVNINAWEKYCNNLGLKYYRYENKSNHDVFLFFSKKEDYIKKGLYYHYFDKREVKPPNDSIALGYLYGYPDCCIKTFIDNIKLIIQEKDFELKMKIIQKSKSNFLPIYTNNFYEFRPIFHHVHSYHCRNSIKIGKENLSIFKEYPDNLYKRLIKELRLCIVILKGQHLFIKNFSCNDHEVKFSLPLEGELKENLKDFRRKGSYIIKLNDERIKIFIFHQN